MTASTDPEALNGPRPFARGWHARPDGDVDYVYVFGSPDAFWVGVSAAGVVVMSGHGGGFGPDWLSASKAEAIERVLAAADRELTRARAAVDRLRAELVSAD